MSATFPVDHEAIIEPDERGRFSLKQFLGARPGVRYKIFVSDDRAAIRLEPVVE